jgi:hypothetical protein
MNLDMCLVKFTIEVYGQQKTCIKCLIEVWLHLFFKMFFILKYIKIKFFIFEKIFLISTHQNDLKT